MPRLLATLMLLITTMLWGFAFVAQKSAMSAMGPLTFSAVRYTLGALIVLPLAVWEYRRRGVAPSPRHWAMIALLSLAFFLGVYLQQAGLVTTTVTNGGFLTSLYVLFVPLIALVAVRHMPHPVVWVCMPMAIIGVFLLNGGHLERFSIGDLMLIGGAVAWAVQVLMVGYVSRVTGLPVTVSVICFAATAALSAVGGVAVETPDLGAAISQGWAEILYAGILSTAVAFTMQAVAQQYVPAANAAIILSAESLFAALGGALLLGERLPAIGYFGAALIFLAIVLVETVPLLLARRSGPLPELAGDG
jgi:drug/metabolite transporter (DMT)-like permease